MIYCRFIITVVASVIIGTAVPEAYAEPLPQSVQLKAGCFFPASKTFDIGTGMDLVYSVKPLPYTAVEVSTGYYRADKSNNRTVFISAIPLVLSVRAILPVPYINFYVGGGVGTYYKMVSGLTGNPEITTELPPDGSEFSLGYQANAGIEYPATNALTLQIEGKYVAVEQGKFKAYDIRHDGAFLYGGFALKF
jgi:opacity protein-like surface antigen